MAKSPKKPIPKAKKPEMKGGKPSMGKNLMAGTKKPAKKGMVMGF